ncbi:hypothetical protein [Aquisphaera insulae]|uniref:hypothetical protein n=1 Tax=Aquisphaera insulae TaxID=2712864 RepID=UPI0013EDF102|nr:hypothetical protein [Aquisphaera insulae]
MRFLARLRHAVPCLAVLLVASAATRSARADILLSDLLGSSTTIDVGSLRFENFTLDLLSTNVPFDLSLITVSTTSTGLLFTPQPGALSVSGPGAFINLEFSYDAVVLDPTLSIDQTRVAVVGQVEDGKDAFAQAGANIYQPIPPDLGFNLLGSIVAYVDGLLPDQLTDALDYDPQPTVRIEAQIVLQSFDDGPAGLESFSYGFSTSAVPEPSGLMLAAVAMGMAGMGRVASTIRARRPV